MARSLFRSGNIDPVWSHSLPDLQEDTVGIDKFKPSSHPQGRLGAVFATVDLEAHSRWVRASIDGPRKSTEIFVDPAVELRAYEVVKWEDYSLIARRVKNSQDQGYTAFRLGLEDAARDYWDSGILLEELDGYPADTLGEFEVLIPSEAIVRTRNVSDDRVISSAAAHRHTELHRAFKPRSRKRLECPDCRF